MIRRGKHIKGAVKSNSIVKKIFTAIKQPPHKLLEPSFARNFLNGLK